MQNMEEYLSQFLKINDKVLICCSRYSPTGRRVKAEVARCGAIPVFWDEDYRWGSLLRLTFTDRHRAVAGPPMLLLGLSKLSKQLGVPLYIRNVLVIGECEDWIKDAISTGLDCRVWSLEGELPRREIPEDVRELSERIIRWSSVLDCRIVKGSYGLEMQVVTFPGKKLPKFPSCAKLDVQTFSGEKHIPYHILYNPKNPGTYMKDH
jgi:hypothetical protein